MTRNPVPDAADKGTSSRQTDVKLPSGSAAVARHGENAASNSDRPAEGSAPGWSGQEAVSKNRFTQEFEEWNEVTGALPKGIGWYYECQSIFEDADKEIERLTRERDQWHERHDRERAAHAANLTQQQKVEAERGRLRAALEWYAHATWMAFSNEDNAGDRARKALPGEPISHETAPYQMTASEESSFTKAFAHRQVADETSAPLAEYGLRVVGSPGMALETVMAAFDVLKERRRQTQEEGWTPAHDDQHSIGELADAAACYALKAGGNEESLFERFWPWSSGWWKPKNKRRDLVRAGALIIAEIERLDRAGSAVKVGG